MTLIDLCHSGTSDINSVTPTLNWLAKLMILFSIYFLNPSLVSPPYFYSLETLVILSV